MNRNNRIILCEGETDQILLGKYLECVSGWRFFHNKKSLFPKEKINWYKKSEEEILGIWAVGGNDFKKAMEMIIKREALEPSIGSMAVVTDHDDSEAETGRLCKLINLWNDYFSLKKDITKCHLQKNIEIIYWNN